MNETKYLSPRYEEPDNELSLSRLIAENFPQNGISLIFGYGSKVVRQSNNQLSSGDMVDLIIAVDNPFEWHQENYIRNSGHYSFIKFLPNNISKIVQLQEKFGAQVYFNPFVDIGDLSLKYGVIKTDHLIDDLSNWNKLYVAGRLHKPVKFVLDSSDTNKSLRAAMRFNRESAIRAAMLMLPESFKLFDMYKTITSLSYMGDPRMIFGEDKHKVNNIVNGQLVQFNQLYLPLLKRQESVQWNENKQTITQDLSPKLVLKNLQLLPKAVRQSICKQQSNEARSIESHVVLSSVSRSINCDRIVACAISSIVKRSSLSQSIKGLITAGLFKSIKYSNRKLVKSLKSRIN